MYTWKTELKIRPTITHFFEYDTRMPEHFRYKINTIYLNAVHVLGQRRDNIQSAYLDWNMAGPVFSYKLRYIVGFGLVEMVISKSTIYRNLYENTGPDMQPTGNLDSMWCDVRPHWPIIAMSLG